MQYVECKTKVFQTCSNKAIDTVAKYREFENINEFYDYINTTPLNEVFRWKKLSSTNSDYNNFYKTNSFNEAVEKLKTGDDEIAKKLTEQIDLNFGVGDTIKQKTTYSVAGFQASVPRYLQGMPDSMISKKPVVQKQKIITITKNIGYLGNYSVYQIINESILVLKVIQKIEAMGIRCNLYVSSLAIEDGTDTIGLRVKVKSANERLNLSKLSFSLVHPSMLRRLVFRYREVAPETPEKMGNGYGYSVQTKELFEDVKKGQYYFPTMMDDTEDEILKDMGLLKK